MSDLICRKTMRACDTPGMCSPWGGCADPAADELSRLRAENERLTGENARLNDALDAICGGHSAEVARAEAAEKRIAEMEGELAKVRRLHGALILDGSRQISALQDERDTATLALSALRAALERIEERAGDMSFPSTGRCGDIGRIARAALSPGPVS